MLLTVVVVVVVAAAADDDDDDAALDLYLRQHDASESRDRSQLDGGVDRRVSLSEAGSVHSTSSGVQPCR